MKLKMLSVIALGCLGFSMGAQANSVLLAVSQPMSVVFRVAHQNKDSEPVFEALQMMHINKNASVTMDLNNYDLTGLVIVSVNGHELPPTVNQFDQPKQCSMTTDKTKSTGMLRLTLAQHAITCRTFGGVFA